MDLKTPMQVTASSKGGADVDAKLAAFVDDVIPDENCIVLLRDLHFGPQSGVFGPAKKGSVIIAIRMAVVPLVDGQFQTTFEFTHPDLPGGSRTIVLSGDTNGAMKVYGKNYVFG
jgi:hypothetical protein